MPATFGLVRLHVWSGWRDAIILHSLRGAYYGTLGCYPGLALLGYLVSVDGVTLQATLGLLSALSGLGLGALWGRRVSARIVRSLEQAETVRRSWRDPSPAYVLSGGVIVLSLLVWGVAAFVYRPLLSTWPLLPGPLVFGGAMFSSNEFVSALALRATQRRTVRKVEVSLDEHGALVYRLRPLAQKVSRV